MFHARKPAFAPSAQELDDLRRRNAELEARFQEIDDQRAAMLHLLEDLERERREIDQARMEWIAAVDAMLEPIFLHDDKLRILRVNRAYLARAGVGSADEITGRYYWDVFPRWPGPMAGCHSALAKRKMVAEEVHLADGTIMVSRAYPIYDRAGAYLYSMHVLEDVTERRRAEADLRQALAEREALVQKLDELATHDGLTGLLNHRTFHLRLADEVERSRRYRNPLAMLMIDVDHFKHANDSHGHLAGDAMLREIAAVLQRQARSADSIYRYGGEEFAVILPQTGAAEARVVAERMRGSIEGQVFAVDGTAVRLTVSVGIAAFPDDTDNAVGLVAAADRRLYVAKGSGRNRIIGESPEN